MDNLVEQTKTVSGGAARSRRISNFEILRIIAMLAIVFSHYFYYSYSEESWAQLSSFARGWYTVGLQFGKFGVAIFVMLSGYFGCSSRFKLKRVVMLWLEMFFYSVIIYLALLASGQIEFSTEDFVRSFFPIFSDRYWFVSCYIALMLVSPLLNIIIKHLSRSRHFIVCLVGTVIYSIVPTFFKQNFLYLNELISFMFLYIFAAYLKKYGGLKIKILGDILIIVSSFALMIGCRIFVIKVLYGAFPDYSFTSFSALHSVFILASSAACIEIAAKSKPFTNRAVNFIAGSTFGVYLIHDNVFMRSVLWEKLFRVASYAAGGFALFLLHTVITVIVVFCCCIAVDMLRRLIERPVSTLYDKLYARLSVSRPACALKNYLHRLDGE